MRGGDTEGHTWFMPLGTPRLAWAFPPSRRLLAEVLQAMWNAAFCHAAFCLGSARWPRPHDALGARWLLVALLHLAVPAACLAVAARCGIRRLPNAAARLAEAFVARRWPRVRVLFVCFAIVAAVQGLTVWLVAAATGRA